MVLILVAVVSMFEVVIKRLMVDARLDDYPVRLVAASETHVVIEFDNRQYAEEVRHLNPEEEE